MKKSLFSIFTFLVFLSSFLVIFTPYAQASTIRINAPKISLELAPGEVSNGEIVVENPTDEEVSIRAYLEDWAYKPGGTGEKYFLPLGSVPLSAGKWINFSPAEMLIPPFGRATVRYTVTVPEGVSGGYYSALFFETLLGLTQNEEGAYVSVAGRIGALFFIEIKDTVDRSGQIKSIEIKSPEGNKPLEILTTFQNTGNTDITLVGNFVIMNADGIIEGRGDLKGIYTFPGSTETARSEWVGRLPKEKYDLVLTYDLGKGKTLVEERTFTVE